MPHFRETLAVNTVRVTQVKGCSPSAHSYKEGEGRRCTLNAVYRAEFYSLEENI